MLSIFGYLSLTRAEMLVKQMCGSPHLMFLVFNKSRKPHNYCEFRVKTNLSLDQSFELHYHHVDLGVNHCAQGHHLINFHSINLMNFYPVQINSIRL